VADRATRVPLRSMVPEVVHREISMVSRVEQAMVCVDGVVDGHEFEVARVDR
jgi:hypothetical protein